MENTYTYTARSTKNPQNLAIFTLSDHQVFVDFGEAVVEQLERVSPSRREDEKRVSAMAKSAGKWLLQQGLRPFNLADVSAKAKGDSLRITAWLRAKGLRLAPALFNWQQVDNPKAARAFADELEKRKAAEDQPHKLPGPLDYWATWLLVGVTSLILTWRWLRPSRSQS